LLSCEHRTAGKRLPQRTEHVRAPLADDIGIAVLESSTSRNQAYVAMTRGRHANHALVVDANDTVDPTERLAEIIARPTTAESALAVQTRRHREAGIEPPDHDDPTPTRAPSQAPTVASACERFKPLHSAQRYP